jgi:hypothetical protein
VQPGDFTAQPAPEPQTVQPRPVPMTWRVSQLQSGDVLVEVHHAAGSFIGFLDPDAGIAVGDEIAAIARRGKTGLVLPRGVQLTELPHLNGHGPT